jgi:heat shock protein HslJ
MVGQPRPAGVPRLSVLLALYALLPASAHAQTVAPGQPVTGAWRIEQARTEPIYDRRRARLDFGPEGRLVGHTSCNAISADYTLDGGRLRIGPVSTTRETCGRLQLEQEDRILTALELAATARVRDDGLLELRDADGRGVLRATRWTASE